MKRTDIWQLTFLVAITMAMALALTACSTSSDDAEAISGRIEEGLRVLTLDTEATDQVFRVYRGDYIRPETATLVNYQLLIPALKVDQTFPAAKGQRGYFKVPDTGTFEFTIKTAGGTASGVIEAVEYAAASYSEVSAQEAAALIASSDPFILDVRTEREFNGGHIEGATLLPVQELHKRIGELSAYKERPVFVYCRSGNRSTVAGKALIDAGFTQVINLRRGIAEWHKESLPIVK